LSEFENGKREPSLSQLQQLAEIYRRSISFFLDDGPVVPEPTVLWRVRPGRGAEQVEVQFLRLCEQYHNLEMWCDERASICLPQATGNAARYGCIEAEELAKRVRRELQLGDRPGLCLLAILEEVCGAKIVHLEFEPFDTAASVISDTFGVAILLNARNARWRRNHDLAHELFHVLTWQIFHPTADAALIASDAEENLATYFARHLLMPTDPFRTAIHSRARNGRASIESLFDVAREFDVPVELVLQHMHFLYGQRSDDTERHRRNIEHAQALAQPFENRDAPKPHSWPARYHALAVKALRRGELSTGRFAEYLNITRQEAMRFVEQETTADAEISVTLA